MNAAASNELFDFFRLEGQDSIQQEEHCGIVNGQLAPGIPFRSLARIEGLFAPPYVSSDFSIDVSLGGQPLPTATWSWWPYKVERHAEADGLRFTSATVLAVGKRAGILSLTVRNTTDRQREVPLGCAVRGGLDRNLDDWGFWAPKSVTATTATVAGPALWLRQGDLAIVVRCATAIAAWDAATRTGELTLSVAPGAAQTVHFVFAIGAAAEAETDSQVLAADPPAAMAEADAEHARRVAEIFARLPRLESAPAALARWYNRSLVHFIMNRWDVPEFALRPFYGTGCTRGGCVCSYLWNYGEVWEIMPLYDPDADRAHIRQYLSNDMTKHLALHPISGKALGPWYPVGQEKLVGLIYYYVKNTGDTRFLAEQVNGRSVLQQAVDQALCRDDLSQPVGLVDYGPANDHLELRRGIPYHHQMPDLNGRRYNNYVMAAELAAVAGDGALGAMLRRRAAELKPVFKERMWNREQRWFDFITPTGRDIRWTNQMFKLFGSGVLDAEMETGLLSHLNEREFLSTYGLHSLAKEDVAYDPADVDNGGPGSCTSFPPQIAERLYKAGHAAVAEDLIQRTLWWADCLPYWGDSMVADRRDYRHDTPLQCMVDGVAVAQCVIFGMFGIEAQFDGEVRVAPRCPAFVLRMSLAGVRLRGLTFDIHVDGDGFEVRSDGQNCRARQGQTVVLTKRSNESCPSMRIG